VSVSPSVVDPGTGSACPHCHTVTGTEPHRALIYRCLVCGAPRIPEGSAPRSGREVEPLALARKEQLRSGALRAVAIFLLASGVVGSVVAVLILALVSASLLVKALALLVASVPFWLGVAALRNATLHQKELGRSLDSAWLSVLADERARGALDAATVARRFGVTEARAELWLAELSVQELIGEAASGAEARLRVPDEAPSTPDEAADAETLAKSAGKSES
jgi:hypothetical protein